MPHPALEPALAVDRAVRVRAAAEAVPLPQGLVVRHPELYDVHYLNAVVLTTPAATGLTPAAVVTLADRWQGGLAHRHVVFEDAEAGERAAADLAGAGWERRRIVLMVVGADRDAATVDLRARQITADEIHALQLAGLREDAPGAALRSGLAARLVATQLALAAGTPARHFGAGEGGGLQSICTLFLDEDVDGRRVGLIEEVRTLIAHRGRGLARAVIGAAIAAARDWGADLIVVLADADDWPQLMYARMGFEPVGRQVSLTRRTGSGGDEL